MSSEDRRNRMMQGLLQAFRDFGYSQLTMGRLAASCDLSARALYNHFKGKEDAFRATVRWGRERDIRRSWEAGESIVSNGGSAVDAIVAILTARFGDARQHLEVSPHASELKLEAVRRCRDVLEDSAVAFQDGFMAVLIDLERRNLLGFRAGETAVEAAQLLIDGARGMNQTLPLIKAATLPHRYRRMCEAILYGVAHRPVQPGGHTRRRGDQSAARLTAPRLIGGDHTRTDDGERSDV